MNVAGNTDMTNYGIDHEIAIRKRLLARIVHHMTEDVIRIAADAVSDLLFDADEEMAHDLLELLFEYSEFGLNGLRSRYSNCMKTV